MKRWILGSLAFAFALSSGLSLVYVIALWDGHLRTAQIQSCKFLVHDQFEGTPLQAEPSPEFSNVGIAAEDESTEPYRRLQMVFGGEAHIGECETPAASMKNWIGVFKDLEGHKLERRRISYGPRLSDDFGQYYSLRFPNKSSSLFLFTDTGELKPGTAITIPEGSWKTQSMDGLSSFGVGVRKIIKFGNTEYVLRGSTGTRSGGLDPLAVLVVESEGKSQIVYYRWFDTKVSSGFGDFEWMGDFDGDKKLDFIFAYFDQNGGGRTYILFASSIAKKDELVRPYAFYRTKFRGC